MLLKRLFNFDLKNKFDNFEKNFDNFKVMGLPQMVREVDFP